MNPVDYTSMGRGKIIELLIEKEHEAVKYSKEYKAMLENLTSIQEKCTKLVNENRELKDYINGSKLTVEELREKYNF